MTRLYLILGLLALGFYSWAQYRGLSLFDDLASSQPRHHSAARSTFHK